MDSQSVLVQILQRLNLKNNPEIYEEYLFSLALRYKGWGGYIKSLCKHPEWIKRHDIVPSFTDYLCILLACEYTAISLQKNQLETVPDTECITNHSDDFIAHYCQLINDSPHHKEALLHALPFLTEKIKKKFGIKLLKTHSIVTASMFMIRVKKVIYHQPIVQIIRLSAVSMIEKNHSVVILKPIQIVKHSGFLAILA